MCIDRLNDDPNPEVVSDLFLDNANLSKDEFNNNGWGQNFLNQDSQWFSTCSDYTFMGGYNTP
jgi:hypothetical protein